MTLTNEGPLDDDREWDDLASIEQELRREEESDDEFDDDLDAEHVRVFTPEEEADNEDDLDLEAANSALPTPGLESVMQALALGDAHVSYVYAFNDLDAAEFDILTSRLPRLDLDLRTRLLSEAIDLAQQDFRLDFTRFYIAASADDAAAVRQLAATGMAMGGPDEVAARLLDLVREDLVEDVRAAAAASLSFYVELSEIDELDMALAERLHSTLFTSAEDEEESWNVRRRAIESAAGYGPSEEIAGLVNTLWEEDELGLRVSAVFAAGRANLRTWLPIVQDLLTDPDPELRFEAVRAAGMFGDVDLIPRLATIIPKEWDVDVRHAAIMSIGMIGGSAAARTLVRLEREAPESDAEVIEEAMMEATLDDPDMF